MHSAEAGGAELAHDALKMGVMLYFYANKNCRKVDKKIIYWSFLFSMAFPSLNIKKKQLLIGEIAGLRIFTQY